jgi:oxaloacetate decarboxylase gamma subunit
MTELLKEGLVLMVIGMGVVFVLLTLLVFLVQAVSKVGRAFAPAAAPAAPARPATRPAGVDEEVVSAIGAAVRMYRRRRGK